MEKPIISELYEKILNDEGFVNDIWNKFDQTTKIEILTKSGVDMMQEWSKVIGSAEEDEDNECGKAHNDGAESCVECEIIKRGI